MKSLLPSYAGEYRISRSVWDNNKKPPGAASQTQNLVYEAVLNGQ